MSLETRRGRATLAALSDRVTKVGSTLEGEEDMNGDDLVRRVSPMRAQNKILSKLSLLWQQKADKAGTTAEDCAKNARDPSRRFEPLRRQVETTAPQASNR